MRPRPLLLTLIVACVCVVCTHAQTLTFTERDVDPTGRCVPKSSEVCNGVAGIAQGGIIYVNESMPESVLVATATPLYNTAQLLASLGYRECLDALQDFLCLAYFSPCVDINVNASTVVSLPLYPCKNVCDNAKSKCEGKLGTVAFPQCPPDAVVYDFTAVGGITFTANCSQSLSRASGLPCTPAHETFLGRKQSDQLRNAYVAFGWLGFISNVAAMLLYALNPKLRLNWPAPLVFLMAASEMVLSFGLLLGSFSSRRDLLCDASKKNLCKAQAAFIIAGILFTIATWMMMTVTTLAIVVQRNPKAMQTRMQKHWPWMLLWLVVPTVFAALAFRDIGPNSVAIFCIVLTNDSLERFLLWPVAGHMAVGTICWVATVICLVITLQSSTNWRRDISIYIRLLVYELVALVPACIHVIPYETLRNRIIRGDTTLFFDGSAKRVVLSETIGGFLTPIFFSTVFLLNGVHLEFLRNKFNGLTGTTTRSFSGESEKKQEDETSKF